MNIDKHHAESTALGPILTPLDGSTTQEGAARCPYRPHDRSDLIDSRFIPEDIALLSLFVRRWTIDREHKS